jgi:adenosylhomocysteinase
MSIIRDINLKDEGRKRIAWAMRNMTALAGIGDRLEAEKPFAGLRIALSIHLEAKTACLVKTLARGGAELSVTGSNPLSTQDSVCAALVDCGITVHAVHGLSLEEYVELWRKTLSVHPHIVIDDGGDLMGLLLGEASQFATDLIAGCEETTSGVRRLMGWEAAGRLKYPVLAINDARCKTCFDNTYGTGQTVWDAIMRTTNLLVNGKTVVVSGYGYCGRGIASVAKGLGARVVVTEIDPVKSMLAIMDGHQAMAMEEAAPLGDIFVTATACCDVISKEHFTMMKDGAILANAGHFNAEIDVAALKEIAISKASLRKSLEGFELPNGNMICLIADGGIVNIAAADGHPIEIMDMSFSLQALGAELLAKSGRGMAPGVHRVPDDMDFEVARLKLASIGGSFGVLSQMQKDYIARH